MKHLAFFLPTLHGGGAEKVVIALANGFIERGIPIDLVLVNSEGEYFNQINSEVNIVDLQQTRALKAVIPLVKYLQSSKPSVLISHMSRANLAAIIAKKIVQGRYVSNLSGAQYPICHSVKIIPG